MGLAYSDTVSSSNNVTHIFVYFQFTIVLIKCFAVS